MPEPLFDPPARGKPWSAPALRHHCAPFARGLLQTSGVTSMVKCPYCNQSAMSLARKAGLGFGRAVACQACGKPVAPHWTAILAAIPAFLGGFVLLKSGYQPIGFLAVVGGLIAMAALQTFVVPLVRRDA